MFRITQGNSRGLADVEKFIGMINDPPAGAHDFFQPDQPIFVARAPGRLDVMGGIADYSGSLVLEMPISEATLAAVQKTSDQTIRIVSLAEGGNAPLIFETDISNLRGSYKDIRSSFAKNENNWASYAAGCFTVLESELGIEFQNGARILIDSRVPIGKGVSSSAAIEVAAMQSVCAAFGITIEPLELALLCQKVENLIVGAPCGVMDQVISHCGTQNSLLSLLCQPAEIRESVSIPKDIEFWGIDSGVRHAVTGADYGAVRVGAFMGYRIIAHLAGLAIRKKGEQLVEIDDWRWHGYLSNVTPEQYEQDFAESIPETIGGRDFLTEYGGTTDKVTRIDPEKTYAVKAPTEHGIYENSRVNEFSQRLKNRADLETLGRLMFASHASYRACGLTEPGTERLVELVRENRKLELYGARITGGGSGGTVAVLAKSGSRSVIEEIAAQYGRETGRQPYIFHGSSPGCAELGYLRLEWDAD